MPDANVYLPPQIVLPKTLIINAITQSNPMVITVEADSNLYVVGQQIKLTIPQGYGMVQANQLNAVILSINNLDITVNINSIAFSAFSVPVATSTATLCSAGSINIYNTLNVPFHAQSNRGN